jgi:hypothetical protein
MVVKKKLGRKTTLPNGPLSIMMKAMESQKESASKTVVPTPEVANAQKTKVAQSAKEIEDTKLPSRVLLEVKTSRTGEETPESMVQFLSNLTNLRFRHFLLFHKGVPLSFEIAVIDQTIHFYISVPNELQSFIESQLISQYPKASIGKVKDYLPTLLEADTKVSLGQLKLAHNSFYPIRSYPDFKDVDPLSSVLSALSKSQPGESVAIQYLLYPIGNSWQHSGSRTANKKSVDSAGSPICKIVPFGTFRAPPKRKIANKLLLRKTYLCRLKVPHYYRKLYFVRNKLRPHRRF